MDELRIGEILIAIALLMTASYLLVGLLARLRISVILSALFVAVIGYFSNPWVLARMKHQENRKA